jgi:hypothetical protein
MPCDCREKIEEKAVALYEKEHPTANTVKVEIKNYTVCMGSDIVEKGFFDLHFTASHPLKAGGFNQRKAKKHMVFTYCPFCGKEYD